MPNVDTSVRLLTRACTTDFYNSSSEEKQNLIREFLLLPQDNIVTALRGKSSSQITTYILNLYDKVKDAIEETFETDVIKLFEDSKDNKKGSDLIAVIKYGGSVSNEKIELKFGQETLRAIGIETFDKIFVVDYENGFFTETFKKVKDNQRAFADSYPGRFDDMIKNLAIQLAPIIKKANSLYELGKLSIDSKEMFCQLSGTGSINDINDLVIPTKFFIGWKEIKATEKLDLSGNWTIKEISPSEEKGARINFIATNGKTEAKFLLHWKNDMVYEGIKYPAKTGINSYCFNVWIKRSK